MLTNHYEKKTALFVKPMRSNHPQTFHGYFSSRCPPKFASKMLVHKTSKCVANMNLLSFSCRLHSASSIYCVSESACVNGFICSINVCTKVWLRIYNSLQTVSGQFQPNDAGHARTTMHTNAQAKLCPVAAIIERSKSVEIANRF